MPGGWRPCQGSLCCRGGSPGCTAGNQLQPAQGSSAGSSRRSPSGRTWLGWLCVFNLLVATFLSLALPSFCFPGTRAPARQDSRCSARYCHPFLLSPEPLCSRHPDSAGTVALPRLQKQKGKELGLPEGSSHAWSPPQYRDAHSRCSGSAPDILGGEQCLLHSRMEVEDVLPLPALTGSAEIMRCLFKRLKVSKEEQAGPRQPADVPKPRSLSGPGAGYFPAVPARFCPSRQQGLGRAGEPRGESSALAAAVAGPAAKATTTDALAWAAQRESGFVGGDALS